MIFKYYWLFGEKFSSFLQKKIKFMPKMTIKYSKSYSNIHSLKKKFTTDNRENLKNTINVNKLYKKNPIRVFCINCQKKSLRKFIRSHLIEYYVCTNCSHLNGKFRETEKFLKNFILCVTSSIKLLLYNKR